MYIIHCRYSGDTLILMNREKEIGRYNREEQKQLENDFYQARKDIAKHLDMEMPSVPETMILAICFNCIHYADSFCILSKSRPSSKEWTQGCAAFKMRAPWVTKEGEALKCIIADKVKEAVA